MISQSKANEILNDILYLDPSGTGTHVYFGICSEAPDPATGAVTTEPESASYSRVAVCSGVLNGSSIQYDGLLAEADGGIITNKKEIMMSASRDGWGTNLYFFFSKYVMKGSAAFLWGEIYDKDGNPGITVAAETVPVFYEGQLRASIDVALPPISDNTESETTA